MFLSLKFNSVRVIVLIKNLFAKAYVCIKKSEGLDEFDDDL